MCYFYIHVDTVHSYTALSVYVFDTSKYSTNMGKTTIKEKFFIRIKNITLIP